eukprot:11016631-Lingulodinium_polyedra.AAC.1
MLRPPTLSGWPALLRLRASIRAKSAATSGSGPQLPRALLKGAAHGPHRRPTPSGSSIARI